MLGQGRALSVVRVPIKMYPKKARTPIVWNGGPNGHARLPHRVVKMAATCPRTTRKPPLLKTPTGVLSTTRGLSVSSVSRRHHGPNATVQIDTFISNYLYHNVVIITHTLYLYIYYYNKI